MTTETTKPDREPETRVARALAAKAGIGLDEATTIAFHMTDWLHDLERLHQALVIDDAQDESATCHAVLEFLLHAPEHIAEAAERFTGTGVEHIFRDTERTRRRRG